MGQDSLATYYKTNFALMQFHKWGLNEVESMLPWERYIYVDLLENHIIEEEKKQRDIDNQNNSNKKVSRVNMQPASQRR